MELLIVAGAASLLAVGLVQLALPLISSLDQPFPLVSGIHLDLRTLILVLGAALTTFAVTLAALGVSLRSRPFQVLRFSDMASGRPGQSFLNKGLVVFQVALAVNILVGSGVILTSYSQARGADLGFDPDRVLFGYVGDDNRPLPTLEEQPAFANRLRRQIEALPGVQSAALGQRLPLSETIWEDSVTLEGQADTDSGRTFYDRASPGYFETLQIPLLQGRTFTAQDGLSVQRTCVLSQSAAQRFWPGQSPLGRRLKLGHEHESRTVVGVVGDIRYLDFSSSEAPIVYIPVTQRSFRSLALFVRTTALPSDTLPVLREALDEAGLPFHQVTTLSHQLDRRRAPFRLGAILGILSSAGLIILSVGGILGVLSYTVTSRKRELAVRMALGASPSKLASLLLRQGLGLMLLGTLVGLPTTFYLTRQLASWLSTGSTSHPKIILLSTLTLTLITLAASTIPFRRLVQLDLIQVMKD